MWPNFGKPTIYALAWISRNIDLKYSKYYSLLMLGSSHVRFIPEIQQSNSYHHTNAYSYWLDWLVLRDILKTICNITNATYKGWVGREGEGEGSWVNDASRHRWSSYVYSGPYRWSQQPWLYHKPCRHTMEQNWTPSYPFNAFKGLTGSIMVLCDLTGSTTSLL